MKRILALLLAAVMAAVLAGCSPEYRSNNGEIAVTAGKMEISYDLFSYFYRMYEKQGREEYGTEYSHDQLMKMTEKTLREIGATVAMADEYEIKVSKDDIKAIHQYIAEIKESYKSDEEYYADLEKNLMSEQVMYDIQYYSILEGQLREFLTSEEAMIIDLTDKALDNALKNEFMAAVNIIVFKDTEADGLKGKELADSIYKRILDGEDIYELSRIYSDDNYYGDRYFAPGTSHEYFEAMVKSLEIGQLSQVYESDYGYNITKRIAIDPEFVDEYYEELRAELAYSRYLDLMDKAVEKLSFTYSSDFDAQLIK